MKTTETKWAYRDRGSSVYHDYTVTTVDVNTATVVTTVTTVTVVTTVTSVTNVPVVTIP